VDDVDPKKLARTVATLQHAVAAALVEAHHRVWPPDLDVEIQIIQRKGKAKVQFRLPYSKEPGYVDG
jgi:glycine cleavage system aminomethyltransferase T